VNLKALALCTLCALPGTAAQAQQPGAPSAPPGQSPASHASFTAHTAVVEEVISAVDAGYRFNAYVVRWHGARVLVADDLALSTRSVGESISFIATRHEVNGDRILHFISTDRGTDRRDTVPRKDVPSWSADSDTGTIEEVLAAEEAGYRFVAYILEWHHARIAISDPLSRSRHGPGEPLSFLATRIAGRYGPTLSFTLAPEERSAPAVASEPAAPPSSLENGIVDEVLTAQADGYSYRAYVLRWRGARIVVSDRQTGMPCQVGDGVQFRVRRVPGLLPGIVGAGLLVFEWSASQDGSPRAKPSHMSTSNDTAIVDEVLSADLDGYRALSYIARWHGTRIAVIDALASTHYSTGERIELPVSRDEAAGERRLSFALFRFGATSVRL
jgi:hypothetical protein